MLARVRKWALVSALQKSIRRGEKEVALHLLSAIDSMPEEYAYFWRRLSVIACEDIGLADDVLASFVVACATVFPPRKTGCENLRIMGFLADQMCGLSNRSRIYCSYSVIEPAAFKAELPRLTRAASDRGNLTMKMAQCPHGQDALFRCDYRTIDVLAHPQRSL